MKNCCDKIYKKIKMPDSFDFSMDRQVFKTYYKPVGYFFDKLPKLYYESLDEITTDYNSYILENCGGFPTPISFLYPSSSFFPSLDVALSTLDLEFPDTLGGCGRPEISGNAYLVSFVTPNQNLGKWYDNHPSFLRYNYDDYQSKSLRYYKNPTWLLNFNFCGVDGKFEDNKKFRLKGCDKYEVKWKLRVKPLLFMGNIIDDPTTCHPMTIYGGDVDFFEYGYSDYAQLLNLINATETKEGSRWLGLTPMRLESGIYNYDTGEQTPIVDSQSGYPQIVAHNNHTKWEKQHKDKIQCKFASEIEDTIMGPNSSVDINYYDGVIPSQNDIFYYDYGGVGVYSDSGFFTTQVDNLNAPGVFKINKQSLRFKDSIIEGVIDLGGYVDGLFGYMDGYVSPLLVPTETAGLTLNLEYNIEGEWTTVLTQDYNVTYIDLVEGDNQLLMGTYSKSSIDYHNSDYVDIPSIFGSVAFPKPTNYDYRYSFTIGFSRTYKKIDTFSSYTPQIQNYTKLSEEFTFELNGFTNVNLDKGDIGIYIKVLPDMDNSHNINLVHKNDVVQVSKIEGFGGAYPPDHVICNNVIGSNECYPWGELGISSKTGWQKIENPEYFPLLPLNRNVFDNSLISSTLSDDEIAIRNYRYNQDININAPALYLMIEEGWVSVEPTCENC
jgi:hypothetical protein